MVQWEQSQVFRVVLRQEWAFTEILVLYQNSQVSWLIQSTCQIMQPTKTKVREMVTVFATKLGMLWILTRIVLPAMLVYNFCNALQ
jgi:hypothetical protein